jgi:hypothetical protein
MSNAPNNPARKDSSTSLAAASELALNFFDKLKKKNTASTVSTPTSASASSAGSTLNTPTETLSSALSSLAISFHKNLTANSSGISTPIDTNPAQPSKGAASIASGAKKLVIIDDDNFDDDDFKLETSFGTRGTSRISSSQSVNEFQSVKPTIDQAFKTSPTSVDIQASSVDSIVLPTGSNKSGDNEFKDKDVKEESRCLAEKGHTQSGRFQLYDYV